MAQPMTTSSISAGSSLARFTASRIAWAAMVGPSRLLNAPRYALPMGVRAVETMTASRMAISLPLRSGLAGVQGREGAVLLGQPLEQGGRLPRLAVLGAELLDLGLDLRQA